MPLAGPGCALGTPVAVANVDAHVAVPAATVTEPGRMVIIMGTSNCHMVTGTEEREVPGICGVVQDGIIPGFPGFEAGQSCVGDSFAWFVENGVPAAYEREATERGLSIHQLLEERASRLAPGESGLLALDWWNGNRTILVDADLSGVLLGATLATKPEEIYRALIESTAYGTRIIIDNFEANGIPISEIVATGGLPERNHLLMQIYADVTGRPIRRAGTAQGGALGSAMHGAVARARPKAATTASSTPPETWPGSTPDLVQPDRAEPGHLRPALPRVCHAARLLWARRQRRDEARQASARGSNT